MRNRAKAQKAFDGYEITGDLFELDLYDLQSVRKIIRDAGPAIVFNLAGYGIDRSETIEIDAFLINCELPRTICEALSVSRDGSWRGRNLVHTGTAMEYGTARHDLSEDTVARPTTTYGRSKLAGTAVVTEYCRNSGLNGLTARLFAVYGPGESRERLLPTLMRESKRDGNIPLTAGLHKRDFIYVEDAAEGLIRLGASSGEPGEVVNLATGRLTSVRSFVKTASKVLNIDVRRLAFGELPTRPDEMYHDVVNIQKLLMRTEWSPQTNIDEGVERTVVFESSKGKTLKSGEALNALR